MSSCWLVQASWNTELHVNRKTMIYNTLFVKLTLLFQEMPLSWNDKTHNNNNNNNYWSHLGFKLLTQIILCKFCEYIINSLWKVRQSFSENEQERNAKCLWYPFLQEATLKCNATPTNIHSSLDVGGYCRLM